MNEAAYAQATARQAGIHTNRDAIFVRDGWLVIMALTLPRTIPISLSTLQTILVAFVTVIFLPFHFPLSVLELPDRYPGFIQARRWLRIRQVRIR